MAKKSQIFTSEVSSFLNSKYVGFDRPISEVGTISNLSKGRLTYLYSNQKDKDYSSECIILVEHGYEIPSDTTNTYIFVKDLKYSFIRVVNQYFFDSKKGISKSAIIKEGCTIGEGISIGENVIIEENVTIGSNTTIGHNTVIKSNTTIGCRCHIAENCIIGNDGLEVARSKNESVVMYHLGGVFIDDNVFIGASTTIGKGLFTNTIIGENTKIGPQVNIGHGSDIAANCIIAGKSHLSGSVKIQRNVKIWSSVQISNGILIGEASVIGIGSVIKNDVPANFIMTGLEARSIKSIVKFIKKYKY